MVMNLQRVHSLARQWNVTVEQVRETTGSFLAFGLLDRLPVVLKVVKRPGDEWQMGEVLRAFLGNGTVRILDYTAGAVLLERIVPGDELVNLVRDGDDKTATAILAHVMRRMSNHNPPKHCPTVLDWGRGFSRYLETGDTQLPRNLVVRAAEFFRELSSSQGKQMLLHGDLQHYNVLLDSKRGWVAIDPKGVVGELEYEVGAVLRNPVELPKLVVSPDIIRQRLTAFTEGLNLNYQRALQWSFAQAVLSAIWHIEDGFKIDPTNPSLGLAATIEQELL